MMKFFVLKIFFLLSVSTVLNAIVPEGTSDSPPTSDNDVINTTIEAVDDHITSTTQRFNQNFEKLKSGDTKEIDEYFSTVEETSCTTLDQMICPSLQPFYKTNYTVKIDYINPEAGEVQCSVFPKGDAQNHDDLWTTWEEDKKISSVYTKKFYKKACVQEFNEANNYDKEYDTENLRLRILDRETEMKNIQLKYEVDFRTSGGETYLDLGDWLDALATIDGEKIDIEKTLAQGEIHTTNSYTVIPNPSIIENFKKAVESLLKQNNGDINSINIEKIFKDRALLDERNKKIANSDYVMYLDFFVKSNKRINETISILLVIFLMWNVLGNWVFPNMTNKFSGNQNQENHVGRIIFGAGIILIFFVGHTDRISLQNNSGLGEDGVGVHADIVEVEIKSQRIQNLLRFVYGFTNNLADDLTEIAISSKLKQLATSSGIANVGTLNSLTSEKLILKKENDYLAEIDSSMCSSVYDIPKLSDDLRDFRLKTLADKETNVETSTTTHVRNNIGYDVVNKNYTLNNSSVDLNPFPYSEREANAMIYSKKANPYNDYGNGYVNYNYFREGEFLSKNQWLSLSGCSYNRKQIKENNARLESIEERLEEIKDEDNFNEKLDRFKNINDIMWKSYFELGYVTMAFLPATSVLIESHSVMKKEEFGIIETLDKYTNSEEEDWKQQVAKALPIISLFGGGQIAKIINESNPFAFFTSGAIGQLFGNVWQMLSLYAAYVFILMMLQAVVLITFVTAGILAFILLTLQKLWAFFAVLFIVIYTFHPEQEKKVAASMGKITTAAFRTVLLVATMFLALWSMSLTDSLQHLLISHFFDNMNDIINYKHESFSFENFLANLELYTYYGVSHVAFIVVKIILILTIIFKLPSYFFELLEVVSNDIGERMQEIVQQSHERESMKGI